MTLTYTHKFQHTDLSFTQHGFKIVFICFRHQEKTKNEDVDLSEIQMSEEEQIKLLNILLVTRYHIYKLVCQWKDTFNHINNQVFI